MIELLGRIRNRLTQGGFPNEASVSHGILVPVLQALGWDPAEPDQVMPEYSSGRGRVDFALCSAPARPSVFIEVKGVGRSLEGDRQLFEYAFHEGVPLCILTDGREWSFYLPSGQGTYEDRRVYRLQLDDRSPADSETIFHRYLNKDRVRSGAAFEAALQDYRDAAAKREAARTIPKAWAQLTEGPEDLLVELLSDQAEALGGFRPEARDVAAFLRRLAPAGTATADAAQLPATATTPQATVNRAAIRGDAPRLGRAVEYVVLGEARRAKNANDALVDVLSSLSRRDPERISQLATAVQGTARNHVARTVNEIYPARPDLARAAEFAPGWLIGLNIANREKIGIIRKACDVFGVRFGSDVKISLPNQ
jgi:predicted type IV restriction endonuclease